MKCLTENVKEENIIELIPKEGVRYIVPNTIRVEKMTDELTVRFRVGDVYRNAFVSVFFDEERVIHRKRMMMAPGEMEEVKLKKEQMQKYPVLRKITFKIEET